jgi:hypothetical protein
MAMVEMCNAKRKIMRRMRQWWNGGVGAMDVATGLLLMASPEMTLRLMGLQPIDPVATVFLSWMGAFVFAVGASYFLALRGDDARCGETVWQITSMVRAVVAVFVTIKVCTGVLEARWMCVAFTDAAVALVQWIGIKRKWWHR